MAVIAALSIGAVLGSIIPPQLPIFPLGPYELTAFDSGLSLYQTHRPTSFYTFSPFNDYFIDDQGFRNALLPVDIFEQKKYSTNITTLPTPQKIWLSLLAYLDHLPLDYTLTTDTHTVSYSTPPPELNARQFTITRVLRFKSSTPVQAQAQTLATGQNDFVIEPATRKIFNTLSPAQEPFWDIISRQNTWQVQELPPEADQSAEYVWVSESGQLAIFNPQFPGGILISAHPGQTILYSPHTRLIEVIERPAISDGQEFSMSTSITVYSRVEELLNIAQL